MGQHLPPHYYNKFYSVKQIFVAVTLVSMVFLLAKFTSVTVFDIRSQRIRPSATRWIYKEDDDNHRKTSVKLKYDQSLSSPASSSSLATSQQSKEYGYIIENQRLRIVREMRSFPYDKDHGLMDYIPDEGGQPVRAMITTTWRSGSTFLGDILLSHPATYYHYEPLIHFLIHQVRDETPLASEAIKVIKSLFRCDYSDLGSLLDYAKVHVEALSHNERLWSQCFGDNRKMCYNPEFLSQFCSLFPFQTLKTVRLRVNLTRTIIEDSSLNVQVLLLVRDPRATLQSRKHRIWCPGQPDCDQPEVLCSDLVQDYYAAQQLMRDHPDRFRIIRYEDFCIDIKTNAKTILRFFKFKMDPRIQTFLESHTHENMGGVSSTFRDSKSAPYHWRNELNFTEVNEIQNKCGEAMKLWGYRKANSPQELKDLDPLMKYHL